MTTTYIRLGERTLAKYRAFAATGSLTPRQVTLLLGHMSMCELFEGYVPPRCRAYQLQDQGVDKYAAWQQAWTEQQRAVV